MNGVMIKYVYLNWSYDSKNKILRLITEGDLTEVARITFNADFNPLIISSIMKESDL